MSSFSAVFEWAFLVDIPVGLFLFFKLQDMDSSSYSFMVMYDKDWGYVLSSEPQTLRQCLNFIDVILQIPICYRIRNRKENTNIKIHVSLHSCLFQLWFFIWWKIMVCDCISVMRDGDEHLTSFVEASQKRRSSKSWAII